MMKLGKKLSVALVAGVVAASMAMGASAAEGEKIAISVTGGGEDSFQLNAANTSKLNALSALRHVFEGLYKIGEDGDPVLGQAASVDISDDLLTWTFTLRDDITWSDGQPVVADDIIYGFDYLAEMAQDYSTLITDVAESYEAIDEKTVVINLKFPCGYLPAVLAFPPTYPVRADYVEEYGEGYATDPEKAVYNGPFAVTEWAHQSYVTMELRDDYYDADNIAVGTIDWQLRTDESAALTAFKNNELVYSDLCPDEEKPSMEGQGLFYTAGNANYCVMFNQGPDGNDVLKDINVRKALSLAIDRSRIIDSIRDLNDEMGFTLACSGYVNDEGVDFTEYADPWFDTEDFEGNVEEAKALLAEAGFEDGSSFPQLKYIVNNESRKTVAEAIADDWATFLGITRPEVVLDSDNFFTTRRQGDYDIAYYGWFMDYTDLSNMFGSMTSMADSICFWSNPDYEAAYEAAISTGDQAEQWEHYKECEAILAQDLPVSIILHPMNSYLYNDTDYAGLVYSCGNFIFTYIKEA